MSHVADAGFYQKVSQTFPTNSIILMEGVKDDENLLTNKISYKRMAKSLGLAEQHEKFVPTRGEMVMADVDVDQFSPDTIDCLNLVMLVHSRGLNPGIVLKLMQYSPSPHIEDELINDLLRKRNQHLAEEIQSHLSESDNIMVPWGVAHMPGIGLLEKIWPACVKYAQKYGKQWVVGFGQLDSGREQLLIDLCTQAGQPERGKELLAMLTPNQPAATAQPVSDHPSAPNPFQASSQMVPTPPWARDMQMF
jgi:hypothetical protein